MKQAPHRFSVKIGYLKENNLILLPDSRETLKPKPDNIYDILKEMEE